MSVSSRTRGSSKCPLLNCFFKKLKQKQRKQKEEETQCLMMTNQELEDILKVASMLTVRLKYLLMLTEQKKNKKKMINSTSLT